MPAIHIDWREQKALGLLKQILTKYDTGKAACIDGRMKTAENIAYDAVEECRKLDENPDSTHLKTSVVEHALDTALPLLAVCLTDLEKGENPMKELKELRSLIRDCKKRNAELRTIWYNAADILQKLDVNTSDLEPEKLENACTKAIEWYSRDANVWQLTNGSISNTEPVIYPKIQEYKTESELIDIMKENEIRLGLISKTAAQITHPEFHKIIYDNREPELIKNLMRDRKITAEEAGRLIHQKYIYLAVKNGECTWLARLDEGYIKADGTPYDKPERTDIDQKYWLSAMVSEAKRLFFSKEKSAYPKGILPEYIEITESHIPDWKNLDLSEASRRLADTLSVTKPMILFRLKPYFPLPDSGVMTEEKLKDRIAGMTKDMLEDEIAVRLVPLLEKEAWQWREQFVDYVYAHKSEIIEKAKNGAFADFSKMVEHDRYGHRLSEKAGRQTIDPWQSFVPIVLWAGREIKRPARIYEIMPETGSDYTKIMDCKAKDLLLWPQIEQAAYQFETNRGLWKTHCDQFPVNMPKGSIHICMGVNEKKKFNQNIDFNSRPHEGNDSRD